VLLCVCLQFGGLEAIATGILDEWPHLRKKRELFILGLMLYCFLGGLATTTYVSINEESISRVLYHIYTIELSY